MERCRPWLCNSITLHFFILTYSFVDFLECFRSLSCYCYVHLWFSLSFWTDGFTFPSTTFLFRVEFRVDSVMAGWPDPEAQQQPKTIMLPPPSITDGPRCCCWPKAILVFCQTCQALVPVSSNSVSSVSQHTDPTLLRCCLYVQTCLMNLQYKSCSLIGLISSCGEITWPDR